MTFSLSTLVPVAIGLAVGALLIGGLALLQMRKFNARWAQALRGESGSLEDVLQTHLDERRQILRRLEESEGRLARLEEQMQSAKRYVGVVRYDAFEEVGGNQSFALAMYDDRGDGMVLTALVGRTDCRVYCKPLQKGRAERELSEEEQRAIDSAYQAGTRPVIRV